MQGNLEDEWVQDPREVDGDKSKKVRDNAVLSSITTAMNLRSGREQVFTRWDYLRVVINVIQQRARISNRFRSG